MCGFAAAVFCASARPAKRRRALVEHLVRKESRQRAGSFLQRRPRASRPPVGTSGISGRQCDNRPTRPLPAGMRQKRPPSGRTNPLYAHVVFVLRRSPFFRWKGCTSERTTPKEEASYTEHASLAGIPRIIVRISWVVCWRRSVRICCGCFLRVCATRKATTCARRTSRSEGSRQRVGSFLQRRPRASRPPVRTSGISGRQCDNRPTRPLPAGMRQKRPPSGRTDPMYAVASPCVCGTSGHSSVPLPHKA